MLTPKAETPIADVLKATRMQPTLVIYPKWRTVPDPTRPGRVLKAGAGPPGALLGSARALLRPSDGEGGPAAVITTARVPVTLTVAATGEVLAAEATPPVESLRTFVGPELEPVVIDGRGQVIVARAHDRPLYLLSDPDLVNNHGVVDLRTARAAVAMVTAIADGAPIVWDVTLNGFGKEPVRNPMKALFLPPLLPATLCLFVAAALTGLSARGRFGALEGEVAAYGFGKRALADSAASLFAQAGREPRFAPRYAELARTAAVAATSLPPGGREAQDAALDRIGTARGAGSWSQVEAAARGVTTVRGLMASARRTWTWRREMTRGRG